MRTSPLLLGASLIFWGWQTGLWYAAVAMALVLEGSRLVKLRFDFSPSDFYRISDLCTLLFLGVFIYLYSSYGFAKALLVLLRWLPVIL
ncbi:MAG: transglutaminase domain-containing protein, partial [Deltaproteobacteria bacterium]